VNSNHFTENPDRTFIKVLNIPQIPSHTSTDVCFVDKGMILWF